MFNIVLYQPEIPPNTGNIMRLCVNTGSSLHLIKPLGFFLDSKRMRRAGMDYIDLDLVQVHNNLDAFLSIPNISRDRVFLLSTKADVSYSKVKFKAGDTFLFGPETRGLPEAILTESAPQNKLKIPMQPRARSLNLANSVAIVVYEAWRQHGFSTKVAREPAE